MPFAEAATEASNKVAFVEDRVFKLRGSPVVAGSAQLKPHVDFLLTRVRQCKSKLTDLTLTNASKPRAAAPVVASSGAVVEQMHSQLAEVVVADMLSPQLGRASDLEEVPPPVKLEPRGSDDRKSKSHIERRSSAMVETAASGSGDIPKREMPVVSALDLLSPGRPAASVSQPIPKSPRGLEKVGATPLMKISSSPRPEPLSTSPGSSTTPVSKKVGGSAISASERDQQQLRAREQQQQQSIGGLGSPPERPFERSSSLTEGGTGVRRSVTEFDKVMGRVRGDSLTADDANQAATVAAASAAVGDDKTNWKSEHDKMAQKFEAARSLILKLQEKNRRIELQAAQVPALVKQISALEGRAQKLTVVKTHYEEKIPQLNARIVELENELFVLKHSRSSGSEHSFVVGERVWVNVKDLWHEAVVTERTVDDAFVVKLESNGETAVLPVERVRKITVQGLESMPMVAVDSEDSLEAEVAAVTGTPSSRTSSGNMAQSVTFASSSPTLSSQQLLPAGGRVSPIPIAAVTPAATAPERTPSAPGTSSRAGGMDALLSSTKQNMKNLFGGGGVRRKTDAGSSASTSVPSSGAASSTTSSPSPAAPAKAQDKLRSLFQNRGSVMVSKGSSLALEEVGAPVADEIPVDAIALGDLQRIYVSDLWSALMDPASSEALFEVFFTTYEYHCTWEQVFATISTIYNESQGPEEEALERRTQTLKLLQKWVQYSPDLIKVKATPADFAKSFAFADPASLGTNGEDSESLQARGKFVVGDYSTMSAKSAPPTMVAGSVSASGSLPTVVKPRDGVRSPAAGRGTAKKLAPSGASNSNPQLVPPPGGSSSAVLGTPKSPRLRARTDVSPTTSPRGGMSTSEAAAAMADDSSFRGDDDLSDLSDEDEVTFEENEENDLRTRKKGHALFKSIGAVYKSLNMDTQSLQKTFVSNSGNANSNSNVEGGATGESEADDSSASLSDSGKQLGFMDALNNWIEGSNVAADKSNPEMEKLLHALQVWRRGPSRRKSKSVVAKKLVHQKKGMLSSVREAANVQIIGFSPYAVAKQLFLEEWELYNAIKPAEFRRLRFMDAKSGHSFQYMVHRFNTWCSWIATEVLNRITSLERANTIEFFIEVASECNKFHNFNSAYAIIGALNQPSVARLKFSWSRVSKKSMRTYNRVLAFWSTSHNMGNYRAELKKVKPPAVPYLGLIGKDLFQTEMGTPTILSLKTDEEWVLNFYKLRSLAQQFRFISSLQQPADAPDWEPNMDLATCISAVTPFTDDEAYERSLKLEPRKITQSELYTLEHGPSVLAAPPNGVGSEESHSGDGSGAGRADGSAGSGGSGNSATTAGATVVLLKLKPDLESYRMGSPDLDKLVKGGETSTVASLEMLATIASIVSRCAEFGGAGGKKASFSVAALVTWLVRELHLLQSANKFDVEAAEAAKNYATKVVEGMRNAGFIVPAKKWAAKLQGTLQKGGFQGFSLKADDQSVWSVDLEELDRRVAK